MSAVKNTYVLYAHKDELMMDYLTARHKLGLEVVKRKTNFLSEDKEFFFTTIILFFRKFCSFVTDSHNSLYVLSR
jgi:hypothetical protein